MGQEGLGDVGATLWGLDLVSTPSGAGRQSPNGHGPLLSGAGWGPSPQATDPSPLLPWDLQKLEEQELRARRLKEKLRSRQQSLRQQLEQLRGPTGTGERERLRADSLDSSGLSSERSDSDQGE